MTTNYQELYQDYGEYNVLYNQLNMPSPSIEYAWRKTKIIIQNEILRVVSRRKEAKIADIGCGNGALLIRLSEVNKGKRFKFFGYDISKPFVDFANNAAEFKSIANVQFKLLNIEKEDIDGEFDVVTSSEVLEHLENPALFLDKIYKSLKKGGYLVLTTPNSNNWIKYPFLFMKKLVSKSDSKEFKKYLTEKEQKHKLSEMEQHINVYSSSRLKKLIEETGFKIEKTPRSTTFFGGPFLDNHPLLFSLTLVFDVIADIVSIPQIGWDSIVVARK